MYLGLKQSGLSLAQAASFMGGKLFGAAPETRFHSVSTDSRRIEGGELFIALCGERFDAHEFVPAVCAAGACCAVVSAPQDEGIPYILVENTKTALGALAKGYYSLFDSLTVGITGSVGKTTTKEFIAAVLSEKYETAKTAGNFNNEIGLPLTLLSFEAPKNALAVEMGMSARGEIARLSAIAAPDIAVITNVGSSHLENLGTRENIALAKLEILEGLKPGGTVIMNGDEPLLRNAKNISAKTVFVSLIDKNCDYCAYNIEEGDNFISFVYSSPDGKTHESVKIPVLGTHNVYNALCAIAVGTLAGLSEEEIRAGLLNFTGCAMRTSVEQRNGFTIIEDCYNASPESMRASLRVLCHVAKGKGRRVAFLGDMRELGTKSREMHFSVGEYAAECADILFTFGKDASEIARGAQSAGMPSENIFTTENTQSADEAAALLKEKLKKDDVILFKASRALKLERICAKI